MNVRVRQFEGIRASAVPASESDLALINRAFARVPVTADAISIREMQLAHDRHDRTLERFPKEYLQRFAETLPGKSVLAGHDTRALPLGKFHRAMVAERTVSDFPMFVQPEKAMMPMPPGFEPKRAKVNFLDAGFYVPNDAAAAPTLTRIDQGIYDFVSIGFRYDDIICDLCGKSYLRSDCPHVTGRPDAESGKVCTVTYGGDTSQAEAMEGSIVYLGAQQGARIKAAFALGEIDPRALAATPYGEDLVELKAAEDLARRFGALRKVWAPGTASWRADWEPSKGLAHQIEAEWKAWHDAEKAASGAPPQTPPASPIIEADSPPPENSMTLEEAEARIKELEGERDAAVQKTSDLEAALEAEKKDAGGNHELAAARSTRDAALKQAHEAEQAASKTRGELITMQDERDRLAGKLKSAEEKLSEAEPLAEVGRKALSDLRTEHVENVIRTAGDPVSAQQLADLNVDRRDYGKLKALRDSSAEAVLRQAAKYRRSGDSDSRGEAPRPAVAIEQVFQEVLAGG